MTSPLQAYSYRDIWKIAYPILISLIMEQLIGMTDTAFMGRIGEVELGACAIAGVYYMVIFMVGFGFCIGSQIIMARRNGERHYGEIGAIFYHGLYFLIAFALLAFIVSKTLSPLLLSKFVSSEHIYEAAMRYIDWRIFGFFFSFAATMFRSFYVATTQTKTLTLNSIIMVSSNVVFNWILVFGKLGLPAMGIAGAALGSVLAELVSLLFFITHTARRIDTRRYGLNTLPRIDRRIMKHILNISVWTMVQNFLSISTWFMFFIFVEHLGERSLAITNIIRSLSSFLFMIVSAYASTCGSLVSNLIGAGRADSVTYTIRQHVRLAYICVLPLAAFFSICPRLVISIYSDIPELIDASVPSLWVLCSAYLFMAPSNIYFQSISGTGNTSMAFALELCALVLYVAYCFFIIMYLRLDVAWCWTSEIAYALLIFTFSYTYIRSGRWRGKTL